MLRVHPFSEFRHLFNNKKLKKVVNVYQPKMKNKTSVCGVGDYYRGCFMLYYICKMLNLAFDINMKNHPMSEFIVTSRHEDKSINYDEVMYMEDYADINVYMNNLINYLNRCTNEICYILCNLRYDDFNVSHPVHNVVQTLTPLLRNKLRPNDALTEAVEERLNLLNLQKKNYGIIHLRCGDNFMLEDDKFNVNKDGNIIMNKNYFTKMVNILKRSNIHNKKYLIIGDNNSVKAELNKIFPHFISMKNEIVHLGQSKEQSYDAVKETMIDFYLMALSRDIISFTVYGHGSGFSKWCAVIYGIRFNQHHLLESHIPVHLKKMGFLFKN